MFDGLAELEANRAPIGAGQNVVKTEDSPEDHGYGVPQGNGSAHDSNHSGGGTRQAAIREKRRTRDRDETGGAGGGKRGTRTGGRGSKGKSGLHKEARMRYEATVKFINYDKSFGFLTSDEIEQWFQGDVFFHRNNMFKRQDFDLIKKGDTLKFYITMKDENTPIAESVKLSNFHEWSKEDGGREAMQKTRQDNRERKGIF